MDPPTDAPVAIAQLEPSISTVNTCVRGVVTLVWPYSASRRSFSILLVEPDFRLRRNKGQIRVTFKRACAKALARAGISSGDEVKLRLAGCRWLEEDSSLQTPGRSAGWELGFDRQVHLELRRPNSDVATINIERSSSPEPLRPFTPPQARTPVDHASPISPISVISTTSTWSTPAFLRRKKRDISSSIGATQFSFLDDENLNDEQPAKRVKFGKGPKRWRIVEKSPSPERAEQPFPKTSKSTSASASSKPRGGDGSNPFGPPLTQESVRNQSTLSHDGGNRYGAGEAGISEPRAQRAAHQPIASATSSFESSGRVTPSFPLDDHPAALMTFGSGFTENSTPYSQSQRQPTSQKQSPSDIAKIQRILDFSDDDQQQGPSGADDSVQTSQPDIVAYIPQTITQEPESMYEPPDSREPQALFPALAPDNAGDGAVPSKPGTGDRRQVTSFDFALNPQPQNLNPNTDHIQQPMNLPSLPFQPINVNDTFIGSSSDAIGVQTPGLGNTFFNFDQYGDTPADLATVTFDMSTTPGPQDLASFPLSPSQQQFIGYPRLPTTNSMTETMYASQHSIDTEPYSSMSDDERGQVLPDVHTVTDSLAAVAPNVNATGFNGPGVADSSGIASADSSAEQTQSVMVESSSLGAQTTATLENELANTSAIVLTQEPEVIELSSGEESSESEDEDAQTRAPRDVSPTEYEDAEDAAISDSERIPVPGADETPTTFLANEPRSPEDGKPAILKRDRTSRTPHQGTTEEQRDKALERRESVQTIAQGPGGHQTVGARLQSPAYPPDINRNLLPSRVELVKNADTISDYERSEPETEEFTTSVSDDAAQDDEDNDPSELQHPKEKGPEADAPIILPDTPPAKTRGMDGNASLEVTPTPESLHDAIFSQVPQQPDHFSQQHDMSAPSTAAREKEEQVSQVAVVKAVELQENDTSELVTAEVPEVQQKELNTLPATNPVNIEDDETYDEAEGPKEYQNFQPISTNDVGVQMSPSSSKSKIETGRGTSQREARANAARRLRAFRNSGGQWRDEILPPPPISPVRLAQSSQERQTKDAAALRKSSRKQSFREAETVVGKQLGPKAESRVTGSRPSRRRPSEAELPLPKPLTRSRRTQKPPVNQPTTPTTKASEQPMAQPAPVATTPTKPVDPVSAQLLAEVEASPEPLSSLPVTSGVRTKHAYYTPLSSLHQHVNSEVDVLAVIVGASPIERATSGPRDWHMTAYVIDPNMETIRTRSPLRSVQIFRPSKSALPRDTTPGDVLLLHSFKCITRMRRPVLLSTAQSGWAVLSPKPIRSKGGSGGRSNRKDLEQMVVKIPGAPLDYGSEELDLARNIYLWWDHLHERSKTALLMKVEQAREQAREMARRKSGRKGVPVRGEITHELRSGSRYPYTDTRLLWSDEVEEDISAGD